MDASLWGKGGHRMMGCIVAALGMLSISIFLAAEQKQQKCHFGVGWGKLTVRLGRGRGAAQWIPSAAGTWELTSLSLSLPPFDAGVGTTPA